MTGLNLTGCHPIPLAHYLKALGIHRVLANQVDASSRSSWENDIFHLHSSVSRERLMEFFLREYMPSPLVAPWNGGSGFFSSDNQKALETILDGDSKRFSHYRRTIAVSKDILEGMGLNRKPDKEEKFEVLASCRSRLPEEALEWVDSAYVLTGDGARYPPLLGTGGNDGRLEFTNNYMQNLCEVISPRAGSPTPMSKSWLEGSLFGTPIKGLIKKRPVGQFLPGHAGGANSESGFSSDSLVNPWDFILMMEGSLLFAAAASKKMNAGTDSGLSYPFSVRPSGVGYGSSALADERLARAEMWLPLWSELTSYQELRMLMSEGRARVGYRPARTGVDFARSIATLGVDRGIDSFIRYGFLVRNGLAYFATPLGRFEVKRQPQAELLFDIDGWHSRFRQKASKEGTPFSIMSALRNLEDSIMALCQDGSRKQAQRVLISLGDCERTLVSSGRWAVNNKVPPIQPLSPRWLTECDDGSPEYRLASSLASVYWKDWSGDGSYVPLRMEMEPVRIHWGTRSSWSEDNGSPGWAPGDVYTSLYRILMNRVIKAIQSGTTYSFGFKVPCPLPDLTDFIEDRIDLQKLESLLWGMVLINWRDADGRGITSMMPERMWPGALFALVKSCFMGTAMLGEEIPTVPDIIRRAYAGDPAGASQIAIRRLRGSGHSPMVENMTTSPAVSKRVAAATILPLSGGSMRWILERILDEAQSEEKDRSE